MIWIFKTRSPEHGPQAVESIPWRLTPKVMPENRSGARGWRTQECRRNGVRGPDTAGCLKLPTGGKLQTILDDDTGMGTKRTVTMITTAVIIDRNGLGQSGTLECIGWLCAVGFLEVLMHRPMGIGNRNSNTIAETERQQADKQCQHDQKPSFQQMGHSAEQSSFERRLSRPCWCQSGRGMTTGSGVSFQHGTWLHPGIQQAVMQNSLAI